MVEDVDKDARPTSGPGTLDDSDKETLLREIHLNVKLEDLCVALDFVFAMQVTSLDDPHLNAALQPQ